MEMKNEYTSLSSEKLGLVAFGIVAIFILTLVVIGYVYLDEAVDYYENKTSDK